MTVVLVSVPSHRWLYVVRLDTVPHHNGRNRHSSKGSIAWQGECPFSSIGYDDDDDDNDDFFCDQKDS